MTISTRVVVLSNPKNDPLVQKIIDLVGVEVVEEIDDWDDPEDTEYFSIHTKFEPDLMVQGDDSWAGVTRIHMDGDVLVVTGHFGDDGEIEWRSDESDWKNTQFGILTEL